ncbi:hypothetical protein EDB92DRAFT_1862315 [Lactarius akahatsu]|uniref:Uncharacterized protein n=1 Tax=Lactarius akahatsu TaxID=416441 RepID=A0AAD4LJN3_9AGAM|nr:hypothetical protein EDB92DRAFT_1862315 [Lactarius akahatsu]
MRHHRTDFIGDMAFGGGFEIMKAGRDIDGVWTHLESGMWYVHTRVLSVCSNLL